ncbi:MAG TPA: sugar ABC transporter permease [Devosia sp.]|jgi:glucose/mannose transport system permease protein|nr:sugar ABC transporter permease [Devosia sp.]
MAERTRRKLPISSVIATIPLMIVSVGVYIFGIGLSVYFSFTNTVVFPDYKFIGFHQYERLWSTDIWLTAVKNIWLFGILSIIANLVFGYLLAVFMDQRIKQEDLLRTIFLYPFAMSLIVTGLVWQWVLDPNYGLNATMHEFGWTSFYFSPLNDAKTALYGLVVAGVWQGAGVTMAILLAGLRGIDAEIWKAARVDGIPAWRTYLFIALPMMRGAVATTLILQCIGTLRIYDIIVSMTGAGPGNATMMPAVYVLQMLSDRQNAAQGMAAATMMLLPVVIVLGGVGLYRAFSGRKVVTA